MATMTITQVAPAAEAAWLRFQSPAPAAAGPAAAAPAPAAAAAVPAAPTATGYEQAFHAVFRIIFEHPGDDWNDTLSQDIRVWSVKIAKVDLRALRSLDDVHTIACASVQELAEKVLLNPLDGSPLQEPVLERTWVWEKRMYDDYRELINRSPFDKEPMAAALPHTFAQKIMAWLATTKAFLQAGARGGASGVTRPETKENREIVPAFARPFVSLSAMEALSPQDRLIYYLQLAQKANLIQKNKQQLAKCRQSRTQTAQFSEAAAAKVKKSVDEAKKEAKVDLQRVNDRIDAMDVAHRAQIDILHNGLAAARREQERLSSALQAQQEATQKIGSNVTELSRQYAQKCVEVEAMKNARRRGGFCVIL